MHADVACQIFKFAGQSEEFLHFLFALVTFLQLRLGGQRFAQRHRTVLHHRDQFGQLITEVVRQVEHTARVADHRLGRHRAEGRNLRHGIGAVFTPDVLDHLPAVVLTEVDIEVGHRHPLGVQETLKQQRVGQGIKIGNSQRIRHQRARTRTPPRPHRHTVILGPVDEVGHDEEVTGEPHLDDGVALEGQTCFVLGTFALAYRCIGIQLRQPLFQSTLGFGDQKII